ncbi:chromate transporter [Parageobacillus thermantarcticus]|uniref:Chromate transporter n=1 Tax=Parageobacillus thermantarcticus TaxID=186116 RepID=A0A1I0TRI4_9BACL|nr:chromate transporter [Parageobacillus thermantarcticus]
MIQVILKILLPTSFGCPFAYWTMAQTRTFLLIIGMLPFWNWLRHHPRFQAALGGINAAVVGILLAALYHPVWTKAVKSPLDFSLALAAFALLTIWKWPPWLVVVFSFAAGAIFSFVL